MHIFCWYRSTPRGRLEGAVLGVLRGSTGRMVSELLNKHAFAHMSTNLRLALEGGVDEEFHSSSRRNVAPAPGQFQWSYQNHGDKASKQRRQHNKAHLGTKLPDRSAGTSQITVSELIVVLDEQYRAAQSGGRHKNKTVPQYSGFLKRWSPLDVITSLGRIDTHGKHATLSSPSVDRGASSVLDTLFIKAAQLISMCSFNDRASTTAISANSSSSNTSNMQAELPVTLTLIGSLRRLKHIWTGSEACCVLLDAITAQLADIATSPEVDVSLLDLYDAMLLLKECQYLSSGNSMCIEALDRYGEVLFHILDCRLSSAKQSPSAKGVISWAQLDAAMWGALWIQDMIEKMGALDNTTRRVNYIGRLNALIDDISERLEHNNKSSFSSSDCANYPGLASLLARTVRRLGELHFADINVQNRLLRALADKIATRKRSLLYTASDLADILTCFDQHGSMEPGLQWLVLQYCTENLRMRASDGLLAINGRQLELILNNLKTLRTSSVCTETSSLSSSNGDGDAFSSHPVQASFRGFLGALALIVDSSPLYSSGECMYTYRTIARSIGAMRNMSDGYREVRALQDALLRKLTALRGKSGGSMRPQDVGDVMRGLQHCKQNFVTSSATSAFLSIVSDELNGYCASMERKRQVVVSYSPASLSMCIHGMRSMETFTTENVSILRAVSRILRNHWHTGTFSALDVAMAMEGFRYISYGGNDDASAIISVLTSHARREAAMFTPHQVTSCLFGLHNIDMCDDALIEFLSVMADVLVSMHERGVTLSSRDFTMSLLSLRHKSINEPVIKRLVDALRLHIDTLRGPFSPLDLNDIKTTVRDIKLNEGVPTHGFADINELPPYVSWNALRHGILRKIRADRITTASDR